MKKVFTVALVIMLLISAVPAQAFDVSISSWLMWNTVTVSDAEDGNSAFLAIFSEGILQSTTKQTVENGSARFTRRFSDGEYAKIFVWDGETLEPEGEYPFNFTLDGVNGDGFVFSDNQKANNSSSIGYKTLKPFIGEYTVTMLLTVEQKGDNAIMLGDSGNGDLSYGTSSAILLFNGDNFSVRSGNGSGTYTSEASVLCPVTEGVLYTVTLTGNVVDNTYKVSISDGNRKYESGLLTARMNAEKINTLAFISNGKNTTVKNDYYSDYAFYARKVDINAEYEQIDTSYEYSGFAGLYYGLKADGKYIRGNKGKLSCDYTAVSDDSAKFIPRDMGDGSYAFVCKSSNNRITVSDAQNLLSAAYDINSDIQHWILEKSENYSNDNLSYYMKNLATGEYIGTGTVSGQYVLVKTTEANKKEITFEPLYDDSLLYLVSTTEAYQSLSKAQRERFEVVYESVAGDIFGRYGGHAEWTPRIRMDNLFTEILSGSLSEGEQITKFNEFLNATNGFIYSNQASYEMVSTSIPETEGLYAKIDEGTAGTYDFWRGTMLEGVLYKYSIYTAEGELQQTIDLYVQNDGTARTNAETFKKIILQIPHIFRRNLRTVKVRSDTANSYNGGGGDLYIRLNWSPNQNDMRSTVVHELGHIISSNNGGWAEGGGWANAIAQDMYTPSTYGATNSTEDFAEFCRMYFAAYGNADMQRGLQVIMPERYASFGRLRKNNLGGWGLWEDEYTN